MNKSVTVRKENGLTIATFKVDVDITDMNVGTTVVVDSDGGVYKSINTGINYACNTWHLGVDRNVDPVFIENAKDLKLVVGEEPMQSEDLQPYSNKYDAIKSMSESGRKKVLDCAVKRSEEIMSGDEDEKSRENKSDVVSNEYKDLFDRVSERCNEHQLMQEKLQDRGEKEEAILQRVIELEKDMHSFVCRIGAETNKNKEAIGDMAVTFDAALINICRRMSAVEDDSKKKHDMVMDMQDRMNNQSRIVNNLLDEYNRIGAETKKYSDKIVEVIQVTDKNVLEISNVAEKKLNDMKSEFEKRIDDDMEVYTVELIKAIDGKLNEIKDDFQKKINVLTNRGYLR